MEPRLSLAVFAWFGRPLPLDERLRLIRDAGFDGVMLWGGSGDNGVEGADTARRLGLEVVNVHLPFVDMKRLWDADGGDECLARLKRGIEDCRRRGIGTAVMHATDFAATPKVTIWGLGRMRALAEHAERFEVDLAVENLMGLAHVEAILAQIDSPRLGFCFDAGHEHCAPYAPDCLERFGRRLMAVHLHDNFGGDDTHLLPLDGDIDWPRTMARLRRAARGRFLCLEADANPERPESAAYQKLSPLGYLSRARERAEALRRMFEASTPE